MQRAVYHRGRDCHRWPPAGDVLVGDLVRRSLAGEEDVAGLRGMSMCEMGGSDGEMLKCLISWKWKPQEWLRKVTDGLFVIVCVTLMNGFSA